MNFFNNQIIKNEMQACLFATDEPKIESFDDHVGAIIFRLIDLIRDAIADKENPKALIEGFLGEPVVCGDSVDEIVNFLLDTHFIIHAFGILKEHWSQLDESVPGNSLLYATSEIGEQRATGIYYEGTLRSYLETLSRIYHG